MTRRPEKTFETDMKAYIDLIVKSLLIAGRKLQQITETKFIGTLERIYS